MFLHYNKMIVNSDNINIVDCSKFASNGQVTVIYRDRTYQHDLVYGQEAITLIMSLCPSVLEGEQAEYERNAWMVHNMIGHPVMQFLSWLKLPQLGIWVHDATVPKPKNK